MLVMNPSERQVVPGISRRNLSQAVADELLSLIQAGKFNPGDRLPNEAGLMEAFGVGRNTIREAVRSLVARGVVDVRPGQGTTVLSVSSDEAMDLATVSALLDGQAIADLYQFRHLLEVEMAGRAAARATPVEIETIERHLAAFLDATHQHQSSWHEDIAFHRSVAQASGNVIYLVVYDALIDRLEAARRTTDSVARAIKIAEREHKEIAAAIRDGKVEQAREVAAKHIDSAVWALKEARQQARTTGTNHPQSGKGSEATRTY